MERTLTLVASLGAFIAASIAAYSAYSIKDSYTNHIEDAKTRHALADLDKFDDKLSKAVVGFSCLALAASLEDEEAQSALLAGRKFDAPPVAGCREKERAQNNDGTVTYASNDARSIRRQTMKLLSAHNSLFAHVEAGLSDCETIEARFASHFKDRKDTYLKALKAARAANETQDFPAFHAYLKGGCGALS